MGFAPFVRSRGIATTLGAVCTASLQCLPEESNHGAIELFVECQRVHTGRVLTNNGNGFRERRAAWCKENEVVSAGNNSLLLEESEVRYERPHYSKDRVLDGLFRRARAGLEF